jgi:hypothetical protein
VGVLLLAGIAGYFGAFTNLTTLVALGRGL